MNHLKEYVEEAIVNRKIKYGDREGLIKVTIEDECMPSREDDGWLIYTPKRI